MKMNAVHELSLPAEWDQESLFVEDEELSETSHEEASKVLEQWQADEDLEMMELDEQTVSNIFIEDILNETCGSPTCPLEELAFVKFSDDDMDKFSLSLLEDDSICCHQLPFEERYNSTLEKLAESMRRSQETRKSLTMKTSKMERYERKTSVTGVLTSVEYSSQQLQTYLSGVRDC